MIGKIRLRIAETRVVEPTMGQLEAFTKKELLDYAKSLGLPSNIEKRKRVLVAWIYLNNGTILAQLGD